MSRRKKFAMFVEVTGCVELNQENQKRELSSPFEERRTHG
jgi:hypothetical protein